MSFKLFLLLEKFTNAFSAADKEKYAKDVEELLQRTYKHIGGVKSRGLSTPEGLIHNTAFWKLFFRAGKLQIAMIYKDRNGRKLVAIGTDGSDESKKVLKDILEIEFQRSYMEISGQLEEFITFNFPHLFKEKRIPLEKAKKLLGVDLEPSDKDEYHYFRKIGHENVEKVMIGTPGATVVMPLDL